MDHAVTDVDSLVTFAGDRIVPAAGSRMVHDRAGSPDRSLRLYEGLYHELLNEPSGESCSETSPPGSMPALSRNTRRLRRCAHNVH
jgi:hypothetical protein